MWGGEVDNVIWGNGRLGSARGSNGRHTCTHTHAGISLITNLVVMSYDSDQEGPSHQEVVATADRRAKDMQLLVKTVVGKLPRSS